VGGEVDAGTEDIWDNLMNKIGPTAIAPGPFVVDVCNLRFLSCGALSLLGQQARRCRRRGITTCLVSNQPIVARIVAAGGLRPLLSNYPTVESALSAAAA
jgi:anti-anti-sigma factor